MRIAFLSMAFPPDFVGGAEISARNVCHVLSMHGHSVDVLTIGVSCSSVCDSESITRVHRLQCPSIRYLVHVCYWVQSVTRMIRLKPDVIHAHGIPNGIPGVIASGLIGCPLVVWAQGSDVYSDRPLQKAMRRFVLGLSDAAIALTTHMQVLMTPISRSKVVIVPNGVEFGRFEGNVRRGIQNNPPVAVYVGRLAASKAVDVLIQAIGILKAREHMVSLRVVGDGSEKLHLMNQCMSLGLQDCVKFEGAISNGLVPIVLAESDIFVLSSYSEGMPLTVLEAMASGLPVVAARTKGVPELVIDCVNGTLVDPGNPHELADAIWHILSDVPALTRMSETNLACAETYDWEQVVRRLEAVYNRVVDMRKDKLAE